MPSAKAMISYMFQAVICQNSLKLICLWYSECCHNNREQTKNQKQTRSRDFVSQCQIGDAGPAQQCKKRDFQ